MKKLLATAAVAATLLAASASWRTTVKPGRS